MEYVCDEILLAYRMSKDFWTSRALVGGLLVEMLLELF